MKGRRRSYAGWFEVEPGVDEILAPLPLVPPQIERFLGIPEDRPFPLCLAGPNHPSRGTP